MKLNLKDVKVGGFVQIIVVLGVIFKIDKVFCLGIDWNLYVCNYVDWLLNLNDLVMNSEKDFFIFWCILIVSIFDLNVSYKFNFGKLNVVLLGNVNNLFDQIYIFDVIDGSNYDWKIVYNVFYGFGCIYSLRLKVNF